MKKSLTFIFIIAACIMILFMGSSFLPIPATSGLKSVAVNGAEAITFFGTSNEVLPDGSTYTGPVTASGAINATGTFVMPSEVIGMALHCRFILTFPKGTITIRMNCNMVTFNGVWQIIGGTGDYKNLKGGGSLVMPNDLDEILTGTVRGI